MIKVIEKQTICGDIIKTYQLTQGDSFRFRASCKNLNDNSLIDKITFKVSLGDYNQIFSKEYELQNNGSFILFVESSDTKTWQSSSDYKTEIEVTYIDGSVDTIEKANMEVQPEIKEVNNASS